MQNLQSALGTFAIFALPWLISEIRRASAVLSGRP
jgi:hypothetical protein